MLIHVKVIPDSKEGKVFEKSDVSYIVKVKASAERNEANIEMLTLLSSHLKVLRSKLRIISGHHAPGKILEVCE